MPSSIVQRFARVYEKSRVRSCAINSSLEVLTINDDPDLHDPLEPASLSDNPTPDPPSADDLDDLWDEAISQYHDITGIDLRDENSEPALHQRLKGCSEALKLSHALDAMARDFGAYRNSSSDDIGGKIRRALKPILRAVFVVLDIGAEAAAAAAVPGGKAIFVAIGVLFKTTQEVSKRFDAVATLLEKFSFYLTRLKLSTHKALEGALRALAVEILAHMLCSFAIVTKMIRRNRIEHFFAVLMGQDDGVADLTRRAESLIEQETRLTLTESLHAIRRISDDFDHALAKIGSELRALSVITKELHGNVESSGLLDVPARLQEYVREDKGKMETIQQRTASIPILLQVTRESYHATQRLDDATQRLDSQLTAIKECMQRKSFMTARVSLPCIDQVSISRVANNLTKCLWGLSAAERYTLKQDMATLLAIATLSISNGRYQNTVEVVMSGWLHAGDLLAAFLPMAAAYIAFFAFGKHLTSTSRAQRVIPRNIQYSSKDTITLIDVLHVRIMLPLAMCRSWDDIHAILLDRFSGTEGAEYVSSHAYQIVANASVVKPSTWAETIKGGMTVEMSIVVTQRSHVLQCPWCGTEQLSHSLRCPQCRIEVSRTADAESTQVICGNCQRPYWASHKTVKGENKPTLDSVRFDQFDYEEPSVSRHNPREPGHGHEHTTEHIIDITSFRLVTLIQSTPATVLSQVPSSSPLPSSSSSPKMMPPRTDSRSKESVGSGSEYAGPHPSSPFLRMPADLSVISVAARHRLPPHARHQDAFGSRDDDMPVSAAHAYACAARESVTPLDFGDAMVSALAKHHRLGSVGSGLGDNVEAGAREDGASSNKGSPVIVAGAHPITTPRVKAINVPPSPLLVAPPTAPQTPHSSSSIHGLYARTPGTQTPNAPSFSPEPYLYSAPSSQALTGILGRSPVENCLSVETELTGQVRRPPLLQSPLSHANSARSANTVASSPPASVNPFRPDSLVFVPAPDLGDALAHSPAPFLALSPEQGGPGEGGEEDEYDWTTRGSVYSGEPYSPDAEALYEERGDDVLGNAPALARHALAMGGGSLEGDFRNLLAPHAAASPGSSSKPSNERSDSVSPGQPFGSGEDLTRYRDLFYRPADTPSVKSVHSPSPVRSQVVASELEEAVVADEEDGEDDEDEEGATTVCLGSPRDRLHEFSSPQAPLRRGLRRAWRWVMSIFET